MVQRRASRGLKLAGRALEPAGRAPEPTERASVPAGRALEPAGKTLEPAGRPGASWEGQLRGPGLGTEEKDTERTECSWYVVVPLVIAPYWAAAQK